MTPILILLPIIVFLLGYVFYRTYWKEVLLHSEITKNRSKYLRVIVPSSEIKYYSNSWYDEVLVGNRFSQTMNLFLNQQDKSVKKVGRSLLTIEYEFNLEERSVKFMETFEYNEERFRMHLELQKELTFYIHSEQTKQIFLDLGFIEADKLLPIPR